MNRFLYVDSVDDLSHAAATAVCESLRADFGRLYLLDEGAEMLIEPVSGSRIPVEGPGFAPWSVFNRQTVRINQSHGDDRRDPAQDGALSIVATPLLAEGRIIGALEVGREQTQPFSAADEAELLSLSQEIAVALVAVQLRDDLNALLLHAGEWMVAAQELIAPGGQGHVFRVAQLSLLLAEELAFSKPDRHRIWLAARYHDVGWVLGGDALTHGEMGARELRAVRPLDMIADLVEQHHERFDGSGQPRGIAGGAVSLEACILALAEHFDEVYASARRDSPALPVIAEFVTAFLLRHGESHHPRVASALVAMVEQGKLRGLYA